jgi:hypothetical protein
VDWGQFLANWGPAGIISGIIGALVTIVAAFVRAILRGDLITRKQHEGILVLYDKRADDLKEGMVAVNARNAELAKQVGILTPLAETSARSLEAIRARAQTQEPA